MRLLSLKFKLLLFSVFLSHSSHLLSQNELEPSCATTTSKEFIDYYNSIKDQINGFDKDFSQKKSSKTKGSKNTLNYIPIKAHIVRLSNGSSGLNEANLNDAIANLNDIYSSAFMNFYLYEEINFIDNDQLCHFKKGNEKSLIEANYVPNAINIYFIDYIENLSGDSVCGYTEEKNNVIVMKSSCSINDSSLAHEMGHFFSLIHTHGASNTKQTTEFVDGSNCDTDGDGICDTPADPTLSYDNVDSSCNYKGNETDAHGDVFNPDTDNIMSYSRKSCRSHFSEEQFSRMYSYYKFIADRFANDYSDIDVQIDKLSDAKIYPNPVSNGKIFIKTALIESAIHFQVTNFQGQMLSKGIISNGEIDVNHLASGSYLLMLENDDSKVIKKFIK
ncbi:Por secretion system C-terminal sorting domain-containing protein [Flaviramulus basaltis]|uniref:Por secretion system C-terminal sorting domain-containing protein n=1 Tax=Flaviramulus basaltis TaxID=369401 RepID=A0A1K2IKP7_9FLAO|nr:zinc-dependent metalloprotease [Flaviramulus basaltis]SFZ92858.1 Por secretion system C-terminal sorting domain-containing protein [Flaviramulus basaltis]